jgi:hypothetical protein
VGDISGEVATLSVGTLQLPSHTIERPGQPAKIVGAVFRLGHSNAQVTLTNGVGGGHDIGQRGSDAPEDQHRYADRHQRQRQGQATAPHPHQQRRLAIASEEPGEQKGQRCHTA